MFIYHEYPVTIIFITPVPATKLPEEPYFQIDRLSQAAGQAADCCLHAWRAVGKWLFLIFCLTRIVL